MTLFDKRIIKYSIIATIMMIIENVIIAYYDINYLKIILDLLIFIITLLIYCLTYHIKIKVTLLNGLFISILVNIYQFYILFLRNISFNKINNFGFLSNALLYIDYSIVLISLYIYYKNRKEVILCNGLNGHQVEVHLFLDLWHGLGSLLASFWEYLHFTQLRQQINSMLIGDKKKLPIEKEEKQENKIKLSKYEQIMFNLLSIIFVTAYNFATLIVILGLAKLNNVVLELLLALIIFTCNKNILEHTLHFSSNIVCFIISTSSYFLISRIIYPFEISIFIPAVCGFLLALISSWYASYRFKEIKRGMSYEEIKLICDKHNLNEFESNLIIDYYVNRKSIKYIANKYNYSEANIYKIKKKLLEKI